jgi:hypothetical protein
MEQSDRDHIGRDANLPGSARRSWLRCQKAWIRAGCPKNWEYRNGKIRVLADNEADLHLKRRKLAEGAAERRLAKKK